MSSVLGLHGFLGSDASFAELRARLGEGVRIISPCLPGHGPAGGPPVPAFEEAARRVAAMARRAPRPSVLVGYSMGARVGLAALAAAPDAWDAAILIGVHPGLACDEERAARRAEDDARAAELDAGGLERFVDAWEARPLFQSQRALAASVMFEQRRIRLSHDATALASALRRLGTGAMPDLRPALARIAIPVTLVAGEADEKFAPLARELAPSLPRGRAEIVAGVGHNVLLEAPERIAALVREHL